MHAVPPSTNEGAPPLCHVILVHYDGVDDLRRQLTGVGLADCRVVVVDNASHPTEVAEMCRHHGVEVLLNERNDGFAAGVNAALRHIGAVTEPIVLLNPDVQLHPSTLRCLVQRLDRAGVDGVAPLLTQADGRVQVGVAGASPTVRSITWYFLFFAHIVPHLRGVFLTRRQSSHAQTVDWLCMACLVVKGDAFARFGKVPEDEIVYGEDVTWGSRATASGARFQLCPDIQVTHVQGSSGASDRWIGAMYRLCRRELGPRRGAAAAAIVRSGLSIRRALGRKVT